MRLKLMVVVGMLLLAGGVVADDLPYLPGRVLVKLNPGVYPFNFQQGTPNWGIPELDALNQEFSIQEMIYAGDIPQAGFESRLYLLIGPEDMDVEEAAEAYAENSDVELACPDYQLEYYWILRPPPHNPSPQKRKIGGSPYHFWRWWHKRIGLDKISYQGNGIKIGVLDSGLLNDPMFWDTTLDDPCGYGFPYKNEGYAVADLMPSLWINPGEDLNGNDYFDLSDLNQVDDDLDGYMDDIYGIGLWMIPGYTDGQPWDDLGHGTAVSCVIGAQRNGNDVVGIAPQADILMAKIGGAHWDGQCCLEWISTFDVNRGMIFLILHGADVVNMSFGANVPVDNFFSDLYLMLHPIMEAGTGLGTIFVAAAGNSNGPLSYPAWDSLVIAVGATDKEDHRASYSSYGEYLEMVAPVEEVTVKFRGCYPYYFGWPDEIDVFGTSFAAPQVTAAVGLLLEKMGWPKNAGRLEKVRGWLHARAQKLPDYSFDENSWNPEVGYGILYLPEVLRDSTPYGDSLRSSSPIDTLLAVQIPDTTVSGKETVEIPVYLEVLDTLAHFQAIWYYDTAQLKCTTPIPTEDRFTLWNFPDCIEMPGVLQLGYSILNGFGPLNPGTYHAWNLKINPQDFVEEQGTIKVTASYSRFAIRWPDWTLCEVASDTFLIILNPASVAERGNLTPIWNWIAYNKVKVNRGGVIKLYAADGRMVDERRISAGTTLTIKNYPSGIYFLKFDTAKHTLIKKMLILK